MNNELRIIATPTIFMREIVRTGHDCPNCAKAGRKTFAGKTPKLAHLADPKNESETGLFCVSCH